MNDSLKPDLQLISVKLKNILSFKEAKFENIDQFAVLIGKNNSGKTNLFKILRNCKHWNVVDSNFFYSNSNPLEAEIDITFRISENFFKKLIIKSNLHTDENFNLKKYELFSDLTVIIGFVGDANEDFRLYFKYIGWKSKNEKNVPQLPVTLLDSGSKRINSINIDYNNSTEDIIIRPLASTNLPKTGFLTKDELNSLGTAYEIFRSFYFLVVDFFDNLRYINDYRSFEEKVPTVSGRKIDSNGQNLPNVIYEYITNKPENLGELNRLIKEFYPEISEIRGKVKKQFQNSSDPEDYIVPHIKETVIDTERSFDYIGTGLHQITIILCHLLELEDNSLLLIEEPELFIHPKLQKTMLKIFLRFLPKHQIIITTHSPFF